MSWFGKKGLSAIDGNHRARGRFGGKKIGDRIGDFRRRGMASERRRAGAFVACFGWQYRTGRDGIHAHVPRKTQGVCARRVEQVALRAQVGRVARVATNHAAIKNVHHRAAAVCGEQIRQSTRGVHVHGAEACLHIRRQFRVV